MDKEFLAILVCPICKGKLDYQPTQQRFICVSERLVFPINADGVPLLLAEEATPLAENDAN
ncbi:MAG: Trm112 family protein [Proteobacteria bacterium]|nr:Trm112 family protein [Pseudomonadota bacterium]